MLDVKGCKEGGIITYWVDIKGDWMIDEMGKLMKKEITRGVADDEEEAKVGDWYINGFWEAWINLVTKSSSFENYFINSSSKFERIGWCAEI